MKTAVLTGATSGIGKAIAEQLRNAGWRVIAVSRHLALDVEGYEADLSFIESVEPVSTRIGEECGPIDAFIHVAGVWHAEGHILAGKKLQEFSTGEILNTMNVGLLSAMVMSARLANFMSPGGTMLYISGSFTDGGASWVPYYTSKRGLEDFITAFGQEQEGLRVYGVSPAATATPSLETYKPEAYAAAQSPASVAKVCMDLIENRLGATSGTIVEVKDGLPGMGYHR